MWNFLFSTIEFFEHFRNNLGTLVDLYSSMTILSVNTKNRSFFVVISDRFFEKFQKSAKTFSYMNNVRDENSKYKNSSTFFFEFRIKNHPSAVGPIAFFVGGRSFQSSCVKPTAMWRDGQRRVFCVIFKFNYCELFFLPLLVVVVLVVTDWYLFLIITII